MSAQLKAFYALASKPSCGVQLDTKSGTGFSDNGKSVDGFNNFHYVREQRLLG